MSRTLSNFFGYLFGLYADLNPEVWESCFAGLAVSLGRVLAAFSARIGKGIAFESLKGSGFSPYVHALNRRGL